MSVAAQAEERRDSDEHCRGGEDEPKARPDRPRARRPPGEDHDRSPERRLRVGYVSGDFRSHVLARFIEPFLAHGGRMVYVLTRTSNPSAGTLQDLPVDGVPLDEHVARWAASRWPDGRVGLVVGATVPSALTRLRAVAPGPGFLVPGVGEQDGHLDAAVASCSGTLAPGLVSTSRVIASASRGPDWEAAAASAAMAYIGRVREAGARLSA